MGKRLDGSICRTCDGRQYVGSKRCPECVEKEKEAK